MYDIDKIRSDFPILSRKVNGKPLVYLDNGSSAQKPSQVIEAVMRAYSEEYANVHRGLHFLSNLATDNYEGVRGKLQRFLGAQHEDEILFTTGSTEGLNLVSYGWGVPNLSAGDEIILSVMEHHANIVPWHFLRERHGITLKWVPVALDGSLDPQAVIDAMGPKTRMIALTHMSNVLGTVVDIKTIAAAAREKGVVTCIDGSQAAVHMPIDVVDLGVDFYAVTGHKLYGPSASGAIYISRDRMAEMQPFMGGGDMIKDVSQDMITYNDPPHKFEAGTPGIVQMIGLGAAIDYLDSVGMSAIQDYEKGLQAYAAEKLAGLNWLNIQGTAPGKGAIFSFTIDGAGHPHDISTVVDHKGVAVRAGHHCAQPLMAHLGVSATCRASLGMYNTTEEIDVLVDALETCHMMFS